MVSVLSGCEVQHETGEAREPLLRGVNQNPALGLFNLP
jgi:hypothetical protein